MNKLTIVLSGKKQAGKNTACNLIVSKYLNLIGGEERHYIDTETGAMIGPDLGMPDQCNAEYKQITDEFAFAGVKVYSFADPLKRFLIDVFNVPYESCYGADVQKNAPLDHLRWENIPFGFLKYLRENDHDYIRGPMSGRDIMQIFGTDICRSIYGDCWAMGTYNTIKREGHELALVCDGRFPNEISLGSTVGSKSIRLLRNVYHDTHRSEIALDDFPINNYTLAIDNQDMGIQQTCDHLSPILDNWFKEAGIDTQARRDQIGQRNHGVFA